VLHLAQDSDRIVNFKIEVDFLGNGTWKVYHTIPVSAAGYVHHDFEDAFSAHWVRISVDHDCNATAYFIYH
jgi:hypothetical protein